MIDKKILFLSPYPRDKAPSQRLKYEQYFSIFESSGYQIYNQSFISLRLWVMLYKKGNFIKKVVFTVLGYLRRYLMLFKVKNYDIVYVHLWGTPFGFTIFERFLRFFSKKLIYDIDDLIFLKDKNEANKISGLLKGNKKAYYLIQKSDYVVTCTERLNGIARALNTKTINISSTVDTENRYFPKKDYKTCDELILGWSGSYTTSKYLYLLVDVFRRLSKKIKFKLIVFGDDSFRIEGINIEAIQWREEIEINTLERFDIGLYPLPDEQWVYGKSGLKAIQYMALGIPTIATAIGTNFEIISNRRNGFLIPPGDLEQWENVILELKAKAQLRADTGRAGRKTIIEKYSLVQNKAKYLNVFNSFFID